MNFFLPNVYKKFPLFFSIIICSISQIFETDRNSVIALYFDWSSFAPILFYIFPPSKFSFSKKNQRNQILFIYFV